VVELIALDDAEIVIDGAELVPRLAPCGFYDRKP
jgi:hypothetical protein